jgi:peptidoglycan/LPS O-acetylase OafA/YrhL
MIRAIAIIMVLLFHTIQWLPEKPDLLWILAKPGKYGVDLFFALSGFLVGSLYFTERKKFGNVNKLNFVLRRASRTIPPYFIVLIPAYLGSFIYEGNEFNLRYLFFIQNYLVDIPYFKISWSLCIEEHFYTLLPLFLGLMTLIHNFKKRFFYILVFMLVLLPFVFRLLEFQYNEPFGYYETATHLRYDALIIGVILSYFFVEKPGIINYFQKYRVSLMATSFAILLTSSYLPTRIFFIAGLLLLSLLFSLLTASLSLGKQYNIAKYRFIKVLAKSSYAIYLTHTLTINAIMIVHSTFKISSLLLWIVLFILSIVIGILFYNIIEKPLMQIRNKIIPRVKPKQELILEKING